MDHPIPRASSHLSSLGPSGVPSHLLSFIPSPRPISVSETCQPSHFDVEPDTIPSARVLFRGRQRDPRVTIDNQTFLVGLERTWSCLSVCPAGPRSSPLPLFFSSISKTATRLQKRPTPTSPKPPPPAACALPSPLCCSQPRNLLRKKSPSHVWPATAPTPISVSQCRTEPVRRKGRRRLQRLGARLTANDSVQLEALESTRSRPRRPHCADEFIRSSELNLKTAPSSSWQLRRHPSQT